MKYAVAYYSRGGNTKKVADAVAEILEVTPFDISEGLSEKVEYLFLGNSLYAFKYDPSVEEFIVKNADKIGCIVNFSTSASGNSTAKFVKETAEANGIRFYKQSFKCPGSFMFMNKNRPNNKDLDAARDFARTVLQETT